ncbi:MAG TPA: hydrogenase formation protein HypD, partial [Candidatus Hydrogenedentes bacterium]|nr:hydrogenase formation protein HypD [Candidatus Hydrogenedentota bacterium]
GFTEYEPLVEKYRIPIVVTGFEPIDILHGILLCVTQIEEGRAEVENQYSRSVSRLGNPSAQKLLRAVFEVTDRSWRGLGEIPQSGFALRAPFDAFDAASRFDVAEVSAVESTACISGEILKGAKLPHECPAFGVHCTPERPLGAPMVSGEGACAAYYRYKRFAAQPTATGGAICE